MTTGKPPNGVQAPAISVRPVPTPFQTTVSHEPGPDGKLMVRLQLFTLTGVVVLFLPGDAATALAADLAKHGRAATAGIIL